MQKILQSLIPSLLPSEQVNRYFTWLSAAAGSYFSMANAVPFPDHFILRMNGTFSANGFHLTTNGDVSRVAISANGDLRFNDTLVVTLSSSAMATLCDGLFRNLTIERAQDSVRVFTGDTLLAEALVSDTTALSLKELGRKYSATSLPSFHGVMADFELLNLDSLSAVLSLTLDKSVPESVSAVNALVHELCTKQASGDWHGENTAYGETQELTWSTDFSWANPAANVITGDWYYISYQIIEATPSNNIFRCRTFGSDEEYQPVGHGYERSGRTAQNQIAIQCRYAGSAKLVGTKVCRLIEVAK